MGCQLHPTSKFCLLCVLISSCFHVHLCHSYGDLSHNPDSINNENYAGNTTVDYTHSTQYTKTVMKNENASMEIKSDSNSSDDLSSSTQSQLNTSETIVRSWTPSNVNHSLHVNVDNSSLGYWPDENPVLPSNTNTSESHKDNKTLAIHGDNPPIGRGNLSSSGGNESAEIPNFEMSGKNTTETAAPEKSGPHKHRHQPYLMAIFNKYGHNGVITFQDLELLMQNLGLGMDISPDQGHGRLTGDSDERSENKPKSKAKRSHQPQRKQQKHLEMDVSIDVKKRHTIRKRALTAEEKGIHGLRHQKRHNGTASNECLSAADVMTSIRLSPSDVVTPETFLKVCPVLIYQLDTKACHYSKHCHFHTPDNNSSDLHSAIFNSTLPSKGNQNSSDLRNTSNSHVHVTVEHRHGQLNQSPGESHDHDDPSHHNEHSHENDNTIQHEDDHDHYHNGENDHDHEADNRYTVDSGKSNKDNAIKSTLLGTVPMRVWGYSITACLVISLVGLLCVAIVPCMHRVVYNHMLQFLVALAIGSLMGDALLHLLPHAMQERSTEGSDHHAHDHSDSETHSHDRRPIWLGLVGLGGIYVFFLIERLMGLLTDCKRKRHLKNKRQKRLNSPLLMRRLSGAELGSRLNGASATCQDNLMVVHTSKEVTKMAEESHQEVHKDCDQDAQDEWGVGHSHGNHQHSHQVPGTVAAVAWMVIVGDGLHNFSDGLAIGASFASSLSGGLSTSIAVLCHELPHELGDFAVLLRAGMSVKSALIYNLVSSVLCFIGMAIGVAIGNIAAADQWIFALIAGIFIYVALVDMLPEMTKVDPRQGENPCVHLVLQNAGMITGAAIMLLIAIYEDNIALPAF